jgi:hypothetical protein
VFGCGCYFYLLPSHAHPHPYLNDKLNLFYQLIIHDHHPARTTRPGTVPDNAGNFVVAVLRAEFFRVFADDFRPVPSRKYRKFTEIHGKKPEQFAARILGPSITLKAFIFDLFDYKFWFLILSQILTMTNYELFSFLFR